MVEKYLTPNHEAVKDFIMRKIEGPVVMLNLLRFRDVADYTEAPHLAPEQPISGAAAYELYIQHTLPMLQSSGGEVVFSGKGGAYLIGPTDERWDAMLLIRQESTERFIAFASDPEYLKGMGHRTAALEDSRLLPLIENIG